MNTVFNALKYDFEASQLPSPYDPMTVRTLCQIVDSIQKGEITLNEFEDYLADNGMGLTPRGQRKHKQFGDVCYSFVSNVLSYLETKER